MVVNSGEEMRMICSTCLKSKLPRTWARDYSCNIQRDAVVNHANSSEHKAAEQGLASKLPDTSEELSTQVTDVSDDDLK